MSRNLVDYNVGDSGIVKSVKGERKIRRRLFDMGITPGTRILVRKKAPLGDPVEIRIRGYELSLRKRECCLIEME